MNIEEVFNNIIFKENGCIEWIGNFNKWGYGQVWFDGKEWVIHVLMYELFIGHVPKGLVLDHFKCDNIRCCNWEHVKPVTVRQNVLRGNGPSAINARRIECIKGHVDVR